MDDIQVQSLEEKLKSLLGQLDAEHAVFERMVYKNKNQHRRCSYFQYLLKVRRDLRLLRTANMEETLRFCFHVIGGSKPRQKMIHLESLKWKRSDTGKPNILERLLGAVRLLSQMTEIILKAASEISPMLARSFFIGFSMTFLALLARLRVLLQQILVDAVSVFNTVTSISREKQTVKIDQDGVEVFREFYPKEEDYIMLDIEWKTDKYVLLETLQKHEVIRKDGDVVDDVSTKEAPVMDPSIRYHTLVDFLGEDALSLVEADSNVGVKDDSSASVMEVPSSDTNNETQTEASEIAGDQSNSNFLVKPEETEVNREKPESIAPKMAFLSVKRPLPASTHNPVASPLKKQATSPKDEKKEDGFYNLLIRRTEKDSLF